MTRIKIETQVPQAFAALDISAPTKEDARALKIGDVIEIFHADENKPSSIEVVVGRAGNGGFYFNVRTIAKDEWAQGIDRDARSFINSEFWRKIGTMKFNIV